MATVPPSVLSIMIHPAVMPHPLALPHPTASSAPSVAPHLTIATPSVAYPPGTVSGGKSVSLSPHPLFIAPQPAGAPVGSASIMLYAAVQKSATVATVNPAIVHLQNPQFTPIAVPRGQPRSSFHAPTLVSPLPTPTDNTLFEDPQNPSTRHFLPRYVIAAVAGSQGRMKWVSLEPAAAGFQLIAHLADSTAPALAQGNTPLTVAARYLLTATLQGRIVTWDLVAAAGTDGAALKLSLALADFVARDQLFQSITDPAAQAKLIVRRPLNLAVPVLGQPNLYAPTTIAVDTAVPFTFSKDLDQNVFAKLQGVGTTPLPQWNVAGVNWSGRRHTYYQSSSQPNQVYFLPDAFKIGREQQPPHRPSLAVRTAGDDAASITLTLSYLAHPVWDPRRIQGAGADLQQQLGLAALPSLALFAASDAKLALNLPAATETGPSGLVDQPNAVIDTSAGIQGSVTLGLAQFRQIYDAMFDEVSELLSGQVTITVDKDATTIPFVARASDFAGDVLDIESGLDAADNLLVAVLRNAVESPIRFDDLKATILKGSTPIASSIASTDPALPATLQPAPVVGGAPGALTVTLGTAPGQQLARAAAGFALGLIGGSASAASGGQAGAADAMSAELLDDSCTPLFDFSAMRVLPDPKAIWKAIMENQEVGPVSRTITLKAIAALVKPDPTAAPPDRIMAMQVVFDNGQTVGFDASQTPDAAGFLNQTVKLTRPVDSYVLGDTDFGTYRYRVDLVTAAGIKPGTFTEDNRDVVFLAAG